MLTVSVAFLQLVFYSSYPASAIVSKVEARALSTPFYFSSAGDFFFSDFICIQEVYPPQY